MAADGVKATLVGLPDLRATLLSIPNTMRKKVLRKALREGAVLIRTAARATAPTLQRPTPYRTKGLLRRAISIRASKVSTRAGAVGVFINVRPAKKGQRGAKSNKDPFYWRWINFGWKHAKVRRNGWRFLESGGKQLGSALVKITGYLSARVQAMNNLGARLP